MCWWLHNTVACCRTAVASWQAGWGMMCLQWQGVHAHTPWQLPHPLCCLIPPGGRSISLFKACPKALLAATNIAPGEAPTLPAELQRAGWPSCDTCPPPPTPPHHWLSCPAALHAAHDTATLPFCNLHLTQLRQPGRPARRRLRSHRRHRLCRKPPRRRQHPSHRGRHQSAALLHLAAMQLMAWRGHRGWGATRAHQPAACAHAPASLRCVQQELAGRCACTCAWAGV